MDKMLHNSHAQKVKKKNSHTDSNKWYMASDHAPVRMHSVRVIAGDGSGFFFFFSTNRYAKIHHFKQGEFIKLQI